MKHFVFAAILGALAFVPAIAEAQSYRDGSRGHAQDQRHDRGRDQHRAQHRGNSRAQQAHNRGHNRGHNRDQYRGHTRPQQRGHNRAIVHRAPQHYRPAPRTVTRVVYAPARPAYHPHHHARWQRGHYLPPHYRGGGYYVDHRHHRFAPPPPGHRYVRIDGDAVLIGVATGLIVAVLAGAFH